MMSLNSTTSGPNAKTDPDRSTLPLTPWLVGLAVLTGLATLRTLILPPWPQANPLPPASVIQSALARGGLRPSLANGQPPERNAERALSQELMWRLDDGQTLRLRFAAMRRWESFQLAAITRNVPVLSLKRRYLAASVQGIPIARGDVKSGRAQQSCLVADTTSTHPFGVTREQLTGLLTKRLNPPQEVLMGLFGVRPARTLGCVVISLQSSAGNEPSAATWQRVVSSLSPILSRAKLQSPPGP